MTREEFWKQMPKELGGDMDMAKDLEPDELICCMCGTSVYDDTDTVQFRCELCDGAICRECINMCGKTRDGWPVCDNHNGPDEDWRRDR